MLSIVLSCRSVRVLYIVLFVVFFMFDSVFNLSSLGCVMVFWFVQIVVVRFKLTCFGWFILLQVVLGNLEFVPGGVCFVLVVFSVSLGCLENCLELFLLVVVCIHVFQIVWRCLTLFWIVLGRVGLCLFLWVVFGCFELCCVVSGCF